MRSILPRGQLGMTPDMIQFRRDQVLPVPSSCNSFLPPIGRGSLELGTSGSTETGPGEFEKSPLRAAVLAEPGCRQIPYALPFALPFQANRGHLRRSFFYGSLGNWRGGTKNRR